MKIMRRPKMGVSRRVTTTCMAFIAFLSTPLQVFAQEAPALTQVLEVRNRAFQVWYPDDWSLVPDQSVNSYTMVDVAADLQGKEPVMSRIKILAEPRLDHADALQQLGQFAAGMKASPGDLFTIGGWPALQTRRVETRPQPSQGPQFADPMVLRINTWIAAGNLLIYVHASLPSDADASLIAEAEEIAASVETSSVAESAQTDNELDQLRQEVMDRRRQGRMAFEEGSTALPAPEGVVTPPSTFNQRIFADGFGEVEIAASSDGQNIVVGKNIGVWVASNDGGESFRTTALSAPSTVAILRWRSPSQAPSIMLA